MPTAATVKAPVSALSEAEKCRLARIKRSYTPSEFAGALTEAGILRSTRWVRDHCADGTIKTLPLPGSRYEIPGAELVRILDALEGAE